MKRVVEFIKKYKYQILLIILYLLFFVQMQNVGMYADDYFVRIVFREHDSLIGQIYWVYYKSWSGRLIGQFVVHGGLGYFGMQFFKLLNPLFLFVFCYYSSKIINIKNQYNTLQITLFLSLIILGLDIDIIKECLYWADGTILYLWGYVPLLLILYFILDCCINNIKLSKFRFILSIIFIIIISFTMESTAIILILFLFFVSLDNFINKKNNKKILFLFLFSTIVLIGVYFIPGNQARLVNLEMSIDNYGIVENFLSKVPFVLNNYLFNDTLFPFLFVVPCIFIYFVFKNRYNLVDKFLCTFLIVFNIIMFINCYIYNFVNFYNESNILINIELFCFIYLVINVYIGFITNKENQKYYFYLIIGGICASMVSLVLASYVSMRFFIPLITTSLIYIVKCYYEGNNEQKLYILLLYSLIIDWKLGLIFIIGYFLLNKKRKNKIIYLNYILIFVLIVFNSFNFFKCMYCYHENFKVFSYNESILGEFDSKLKHNIFLKKLKYSDYAFLMPYYDDTTRQWYKEYYNIENVDITWID